MKSWKFIIAGKEEASLWKNTKVVSTSDESVDEDIQALKEEGYTQFYLTEQYAYEFMLHNGEYIKGSTN